MPGDGASAVLLKRAGSEALGSSSFAIAAATGRQDTARAVIAARYDKTARNFLVGVCIAIVVTDWLRWVHALAGSASLRTVAGCSPQSRYAGLMRTERITRRYLSVSAAMNRPNSAGEPGTIVAPNSRKRALTA